MDHLPNFSDEAVPYRIPYLADSVDFEAGDSLERYNLETIAQTLKHDQDDQNCDLAIQEMLWHRTIKDFCAILGAPYDRRQYISHDDNGLRVTTAPLRDMVAPFIFNDIIRPGAFEAYGAVHETNRAVLDQLTEHGLKRIWHASLQVRQQLKSLLTSQSARCSRICLAFWQGKTEFGTRPEQRNRYRVIVSSIILLEYLDSTATSLYHSTDALDLHAGGYRIDALETMRKNGRCRFRFQSLRSVSISFWAALMLQKVDDETHKRCTEAACYGTAPTVRMADARHESACDGHCGLLGVSIDDLNSIIDDGKVAVITRSPEARDRTISLAEADKQDYVAISHVWSHGLGNPDANSMNRCLLAKLFAQAQQTGTKATALWIDTICVPTASKYPSQWRKALNSMKDVYRDASDVLVLDARLAGFIGDHAAERQIELLLSDWMHRLWTLQEMLLPETSNIWIAFARQVVNLETLLKRMRFGGLSDVGLENTLMQALCARFQIKGYLQRDDILLRKPVEDILRDISAIEYVPIDEASESLARLILEVRQLASIQHTAQPRAAVGVTRLAFVKAALATRAVTNPNDEPICLATLLNLDLAELPERVGMEDVYTALHRIPTWLLHSFGARLTTPGFRWALKSFMVPRHEAAVETATYGTMTTAGLLVEQDVLVFDLRIQDQHRQYFRAQCYGGPLPAGLLLTTGPLDLPFGTAIRKMILLASNMSALSQPQLPVAVTILLLENEHQDKTYAKYMSPGLLHEGSFPQEQWDTGSEIACNAPPAQMTLISDAKLVIG